MRLRLSKMTREPKAYQYRLRGRKEWAGALNVAAKDVNLKVLLVIFSGLGSLVVRTCGVR